MSRIRVEDIEKELIVTTGKSSGPGGQHVNKVETRVTLRWPVLDSKILTHLQKEMLKSAFSAKLTQSGDLLVISDGKRSQLRNKEIAFKKLDRLLAKATATKKKRKPTKPTKAAKRKRLLDKKKHSEKKQLRQKVDRF